MHHCFTAENTLLQHLPPDMELDDFVDSLINSPLECEVCFILTSMWPRNVSRKGNTVNPEHEAYHHSHSNQEDQAYQQHEALAKAGNQLCHATGCTVFLLMRLVQG